MHTFNDIVTSDIGYLSRELCEAVIEQNASMYDVKPRNEDTSVVLNHVPDSNRIRLTIETASWGDLSYLLGI